MRGVAWCLAALALVGCGADETEEAPQGASVVWVITDGLRFDAAQRLESLNEFRTNATNYELATATSSDCLPSVGSMFTGLLPHRHGAHVTRFLRNGRMRYHESGLPRERETLPETFRALGYETVFVTANLRFGDEAVGFTQGIDKLILASGHAGLVNDRIRNWLETRDDRPFFLLIDYSDTRLAYSGPLDAPIVEPGSEKDTHRLVEELTPAIFGGGTLDTQKLERLTERYEEATETLDQGLRELFVELRNRDLYDESLIVIGSDHGESLGEHHLLGQGRGAYEELLHVPLAIKSPGQTTPQRVRERMSLVELPRMILDAAHPTAAEALGDAYRIDDSQREVTAEQWYAHPRDFKQPWSDRFDQVLRVQYRSRFKLIDSDEGTDQLYDLDADPKEERNLTEKHPGLTADMAMRIKQVFGEL